MPLSCDGCVKAVSEQLYKLEGITKVEGNVEKQLISVEGSGKYLDRKPLFFFSLNPWLTHCPYLQPPRRPLSRPSK